MERRKLEQQRNQNRFKQSPTSCTGAKVLKRFFMILVKSTSELKELELKEIKLDEVLISKLDA